MPKAVIDHLNTMAEKQSKKVSKDPVFKLGNSDIELDDRNHDFVEGFQPAEQPIQADLLMPTEDEGHAMEEMEGEAEDAVNAPVPAESVVVEEALPAPESLPVDDVFDHRGDDYDDISPPFDHRGGIGDLEPSSDDMRQDDQAIHLQPFHLPKLLEPSNTSCLFHLADIHCVHQDIMVTRMDVGKSASKQQRKQSASTSMDSTLASRRV